VPIKTLRKMSQTDDTMHIPASRSQIEEAVWTLILDANEDIAAAP